MVESAGLLEGQTGFSMQMGVWHYAVQGEVTEFSALVAEGQPSLTPAWDDTAQGLAGAMVSRDGEPYRRVKDHAALPWVIEHILRGHEEWSPL